MRLGSDVRAVGGRAATGEGADAAALRSRGPASFVAVLLVVAVLAPPVAVTSDLTNLRTELPLWAAALPYLLLAWVLPALRAPAARPDGTAAIGGSWALVRRLGLNAVDGAFLALAVVTLLSTGYAALALGDGVNMRGADELAKLALYWIAFRTALTAVSDGRVRRLALTCVFAAGVLSALLALAQYFDWPEAVRRAGGWWAEPHHLRGLERDGRAFGTVGNPNYFGALMALLTVAAIFSRGAWSRVWDRWAWPAAGMVVLGPLGVVLSGSRGALGLLVAGLVVSGAIAFTLRTWRLPAASLTLVAVALLASVALVELFPRGREDYLTRVAGALSPTGDNAVALRLERWRGALGHGGDAEGTPADTGVVRGTGRPAADPAARARDDQRRADLARLVAALDRYREQTEELPPGPSLAPLVPSVLEYLPTDPRDGTPYRYDRTATGFTVAAAIEDPTDPHYPLLAVGEAHNYVENSDLERRDGDRATGFRTIAGTVYRVVPEAALFGANGIIYEGSREAGRRAAVYQQRALNRTGGAPVTASVWVQFPAPVRGEVFLYTNVFYADGERQDPSAMVAADPALVGIWQRLSVTIRPDPERRVDFLGVYLLSDDFAGEVYADGFVLVDGGLPVSFPGLPEAGAAGRPGLDVGEQLRRSPVFGGGPEQAGHGATLDNEYLLVAARYGIAGLLAYLALWGAVAVTALRAARRGNKGAVGLVGTVGGLLLFNVVAGSLYQLQLMAVFWPLAGVLLATDGTGGGGRLTPARTPVLRQTGHHPRA